MTMSQHLAEAITGIIGGLIAAWIAWRKIWREKISPKRSGRRAREKVRQTLRFWLMADACQTWALRHQADRGLLLVVDCLDPSVHHPHVSIIAEGFGTGITIPIFTRWQEWRADPAHITVLHQVAASDTGVVLTASEMDAGALRDFYRQQGVVASILFRVAHVGPGMVYGALSFGLDRTAGVEDRERLLDRVRRIHAQGDPVRTMAAEARAAYRCVRVLS